MLNDLGPYDAIHDLAAGTGHFLDILSKGLSVPRCAGSDVSPSARNRAAKSFPAFSFAVDDLRRVGKPIFADASRPLYVLRGTLWCLYPDIELAIKLLRSRVSDNDLFYIAQNFPPLDSNFIGNDILPTPQKLMELLHRDFKPIRSIQYEDHNSRTNDNWLLALLS